MLQIDAKKKDYEQHKEAADMALSVKDYLSAYDNFMICGDIADEISLLSLDNEESLRYAKLSESCYKQAKDHLSNLNMSKEDQAKLRKRKAPKGFDKFIGEDLLKDYLTKEVISFWREDFSLRKRSAILLYGPEGISKTVFLQSFIHELNATPYRINPILNFSPFSDYTKENMKKLFSLAEEKDYVVFYFTRPEAFFPKGEDKESKATFKLFYKLVKKEIQRIKRKHLHILFIASTSCPDLMNPKVFEKGFFDDLLRIHHPNTDTRRKMLQERLSDISFEDKDEIEKLTKFTHGFVSKEISRLSRRIRTTRDLYQKGDQEVVITNDMMKRILEDLKPTEDEAFKKNISAFESSLGKDISIINDNA